MSKPAPADLTKGSSLLLYWGPPWNWCPSWERSRHHAGWSLTWLWWGLAYAPVSYSTLMVHGAYPRCPRCLNHLPGLGQDCLICVVG